HPVRLADLPFVVVEAPDGSPQPVIARVEGGEIFDYRVPGWPRMREDAQRVHRLQERSEVAEMKALAAVPRANPFDHAHIDAALGNRKRALAELREPADAAKSLAKHQGL